MQQMLTRGHGSRARLSFALTVTASAAWLLAHPATAEAVGPNAIEYLPGCTNASLARNDDGSTGSVALGFQLDFFGQRYSSVYVNNNGNITFDYPMSTYTPFPIQTTGTRLIAPFFGDVDTRNVGSDIVRFGQTTYAGRPAFCVLWAGIGVGYYASRVDKLNHFQLLLIDRSDIGSGDFDMIFNYDQVQWETGQASGGVDGLGGSSARIGYSNGTTAGSYELPGSAINGYFLDGAATGLVNGSLNSTQPGRYRFNVRNGIPPTGAAFTGYVRDPYGNTVYHSPVGVCRINADGSLGQCINTFTDVNGRFVLSPLPPGNYRARAMAPYGTNWIRNDQVFFTIAAGVTYAQDIYLLTNQPIPVGTTIEPANPGGGGVPTVYWTNPLTLTTNGCPGATATYVVTQNGTTFASGALTEISQGRYQAVIPAFYPNHDYATVTTSLTCPDGSTGSSPFNIYIDPSGRIVDTGGRPVVGATVSLLRSDSSIGPFELVPDGSDIMSPSNRVNPMPSTAQGDYGWDVIAGYYIVRAEAEGCVDPTDPSRTFVESSVLTIPPPVLGLDLVLDCGAGADTDPPVINVPADLTVEAAGAHGAYVEYLVTAVDGLDGEVVADCAPAPFTVFPLGATVVTCTASDAAENTASATFVVNVVDTTAPELSLPDPIDTIASSSLGDVVTYVAAASDVVSGSVDVSCTPASGSVFAPGTTIVACSATDGAGNTASGSFAVSVTYAWGGVLAPINANGSSVFKAGSTVPVKFTLTGASAGIATATARLYIAQLSNDVLGTDLEAVSTANATTGNLFRWDGGQYIFNLSTKGLSQGTYRLNIDLGDGVLRTVLISLRP
ncbi:PxKF domain-containing protein [Myxococcota bacterium]|nr:PxKF domain-containing protein [Myxococcota bacterium]